MRYIRQSPDACLAYALLQIGAVSRSAVRDYERSLRNAGRPNWQHIGRWLERNCLDVAAVLMRNGGSCPDLHQRKLPKGRGVAIIDHGINHAISFCDGMLLDPSPRGPGVPESLSELKLRYWRHEGSKVRLLAAINVGD